MVTITTPLCSSLVRILLPLLLLNFVFDYRLLEVEGCAANGSDIYEATDPNDISALVGIYREWASVQGSNIGSVLNWPVDTQFGVGDPCNHDYAWVGILCQWNGCHYVIIGLELIGFNLMGQLPGAVGGLANLIFLTITGSHGLSGSLPPSIGNLSSVVILNLKDNNFSGPIPPTLGGLRQLQELDLSGNAFSREIPGSLGNISTLNRLDLSSNKLNGTIPVSSKNELGLDKLPLLLELELSNNFLEGNFQNLPTSITSLSLSNNRLTGSLPDLSAFNNTLAVLNVSGNQLDGPLEPTLRTLSLLSILDLSENQFGGDLSKLSGANLSFLTVLSLGANNLTGNFPDLSLSSQLETLNLSHNQLSGPLPSSIWKYSKLRVLDLSSNNISGNLLMLNASDCPNYLQEVNMSDNALTGVFPSQLLECPNLQVAAFDRNKFGGSLTVPPDHNSELLLSMVNNSILTLNPTWQSGLYSPVLLGGNPCCIYNGDLQSMNQQLNCRYNWSSILIVIAGSSQEAHKLKWILSTTLPILIIFFGTIFTLTCWRYHKNVAALREIQLEFAKQEVQPNLYSFSVLRAATRDFSANNKLGEGGFGVVYKGVLPNETEIAVKKLKKSHQGVGEFLNEVVLITNIRHRNLVKLKGCCVRDTQRLLVYEYVENKNLAEALWDDLVEGQIFLEWTTRFNICVGIARGLVYLHEISEPRIIHRDIKAPNILLDKNFNAKITDFGLARLFPDDKSNLFTSHVAGTRGYLAPEYATFGQLTEKVDIYSFGVLVLEIVSNRRNIDLTLPTEQIYLLPWAWSLHERESLMNLVHPNLKESMLEDDVQRVINVALLCIQATPTKRPSMSHVVAMLLGEMEMPVVVREGLSLQVDVGHLALDESFMSSSNLESDSSPLLSSAPNTSTSVLELTNFEVR